MEIPFGYCQCGCGEKTKLAPYTRNECGWIRGEPMRFLHNHHARLPRGDVKERLLRRRRIAENGCWEWTGKLTPDGYGQIHAPAFAKSKYVGVHRLAYVLFVGPIRHGFEIDHLCRNRCCFNPAHLEPVTHQENQRRGIKNQNTQKTHCPKGHPYSPENTFYTNGGRRRHCRTCMRDWKRSKRAKARQM